MARHHITHTNEHSRAAPAGLRTWLAFSALCLLFSVGVFYGLTFLKAMNVATDGIAALHTLLQPIFGPLFRMLKLKALSANANVSLMIYTILQFVGLRFLVPLLQRRMSQLASLERALGPVTRPVHRLWFTIALITAASAVALATLPGWGGTTAFEIALANLLRLGLFTSCVFAAFGTALIGFRLRGSWKRYLQFGTVRTPYSPADIHMSSSAAHAHNPEPDESLPQVAHDSAMTDANADESVFIALAAELVEVAGRTKSLPHYRQIEMPLLELQQAAAATHTGQFQFANLRALCEQACDLLARGELESLPDLKAAHTAYQKHDPALFIDLADELRRKTRS